MRHSFTIITIILCCLLAATALAHEGETAGKRIDETLRDASSLAIAVTVVVLAAMTWAAMYVKTMVWKRRVFLAMALPATVLTLFLAGSTIYLNVLSETGGPVHWHADFEIYKCGVRVDPVSPTGLVNRIGTSTLHEHGDNRIHVEGVVMQRSDVDLHSFFEAIGGDLSRGKMVVPTDNGMIEATDGELCGTSMAKVQMFLINSQDGKIVQKKLALYDRYILAPQSNVPTGDCIILEFDADKPQTEHICESYRVAVQRGDLLGS